MPALRTRATFRPNASWPAAHIAVPSDVQLGRPRAPSTGRTAQWVHPATPESRELEHRSQAAAPGPVVGEAGEPVPPGGALVGRPVAVDLGFKALAPPAAPVRVVQRAQDDTSVERIRQAEMAVIGAGGPEALLDRMAAGENPFVIAREIGVSHRALRRYLDTLSPVETELARELGDDARLFEAYQGAVDAGNITDVAVSANRMKSAVALAKMLNPKRFNPSTGKKDSRKFVQIGNNVFAPAST